MNIPQTDINRIKVEFKGHSWCSSVPAFSYINRIKVEFKGGREKKFSNNKKILIESKWNLKVQTIAKILHQLIYINRIKVEFKAQNTTFVRDYGKDINRIKVEFKETHRERRKRDIQHINRIKVEFKVFSKSTKFSKFTY